ncbi:hypothetical protein UCDDA912_g02469 [Diaporthe ampelina]|uniref:Uncharacterized protein n=1 Tax=Diaporthe ampelina TaxID=1214573 RepID=A0A0G2FUI1_9PEZI|nr:hypothetical protein UCDDA912_g02469 [Diaporthe ampelina]
MAACDQKKKYVFDDDKRPTLPYVTGACFKIKRHEPLTPFDGGTSYENPEDRTTRRLDIVRQIRVRDGANSQVVQCRVDGIQGPLVAKIFDPLYSSDDVELDEGQSPVGLTESEWSREAAAYTKIKEQGLDGRYTPRFEGCWSFDIPYELELVSNSAVTHISTANTTTGGRQSGSSGGKRHGESSDQLVCHTIKVTRNVRLLLIEYIPGDSILHLLKSGNYKKIPVQQEQRDQGVQEWRAVWIDFGNSVVLDLPNAKSNIEGRLPPLGKLPPNPMTRCRGLWPLEDLCLDNNTNWIDKQYDKFEPRRKWMEARWESRKDDGWRGSTA